MMATRIQEIIYNGAWQATDDAILRMLGREHRPLPTGLIGTAARIGHQLSHQQIVKSLERLEDQGLIRRVNRTERLTLWESRTFVAWEIVRGPAGGGDHASQ